MTPAELRRLLDAVRDGDLDPTGAEDQIRRWIRQAPFEDLGFARVDHHRSARQGFPEVVFGAGKTPDQIAAIAERIVERQQNLLVTRIDPGAVDIVRRRVPDVEHHALARTLTCRRVDPAQGQGTILVASAGTSDLPIAEEAAITAEVMGNRVERLYDVGVAGLHRLLTAHDRLVAARVIVVVAGMEGALPSVIGGLVDVPVIAVPTSVGYGASFGGLAALLGMLNSCAAGVAVVNIDNGYGAGALASRINHQ
jgi:NCAIR mutase (PurE)-related protein